MEDAEQKQRKAAAGPYVDRQRLTVRAFRLAQHDHHACAKQYHEEAPHRTFEQQPLPDPCDPVSIPPCRERATLSAADRPHNEDVHSEDAADGDAAHDVENIDPGGRCNRAKERGLLLLRGFRKRGHLSLR